MMRPVAKFFSPFQCFAQNDTAELREGDFFQAAFSRATPGEREDGIQSKKFIRVLLILKNVFQTMVVI